MGTIGVPDSLAQRNISRENPAPVKNHINFFPDGGMHQIRELAGGKHNIYPDYAAIGQGAGL
jgi:hypothetical protein